MQRDKRTLAVTVLAGAFALTPGAKAAASPGGAEVDVFGIGQASCASWLQSPESKISGSHWVMGAWSGLNSANGATVGHQTDGAGIVGEVEKFCRDNPSTLLYSATADTYAKLRDARR